MTRAWTVLEPTGLARIDDNLWAVEDVIPGIPKFFKRRMSIVRRGDGKLVFFNAVPVPDETLAAIRDLGTPADLVVPSNLHMMDAPAFAAKVGVKAYAPPKSLDAVRARMPDAASLDELPPDPALTPGTVDAFKTGEAWLVVRSGPRASLLVCDLVLNVRHGTGFNGFMFKLMGFSGDKPKLPKPAQIRVLRDKPGVKALYVKLAQTEGLARIVPSHGPVIDVDPAAVLRAVGDAI
jgi:hypothetical protein